LHPNKRLKTIFEEASLTIPPLGKSSSGGSKNPMPPPVPPAPSLGREVSNGKNAHQFSRESIQAIIAAAAEAEAAKEAAAAEAAAAAAVEEAKAGGRGSGSRKKPKSPKKGLTPEEKEANREKRLLKLVGAVVVKCMSKYSKAMDHDLFKKHAKEACAFSLQPSCVCTDALPYDPAHPNHRGQGEEVIKLQGVEARSTL
jgi:histone-lysine N-methyltransferase SETD2